MLINLFFIFLHKINIMRHFLINSLILLLFAACDSQKSNECTETLEKIIGTELQFPSGLTFAIQNKPVDYNINDSEFKIVTFIDSSGCTQCRLKLK